MRNLNVSITLIAFLVGCAAKSVAQQSDWAILTRCADSEPITVIDIDEGTTWEIPAGNTPQLGQTSGGIGLFFRSLYHFHDFGNGALPVRGPKGWSLLDKKGNAISEPGDRFSFITSVLGGFHRAYEKSDGNQRAAVVFLDRDGKEAFGGKRFKWATEFHNGYAIVRPLDAQETWQIMHSSGRIVSQFADDIAQYITRATAIHDGLTLISTKRARGYDRKSFVHQHYYFDTLAQSVLDIKDVFGGYPEYLPSEFRHGLALYKQAKTIIFNTSGVILKQFDTPAYTYTVTSRYVLLSNGNWSGTLYDHALNPVVLPVAPHHQAKCRFVNEQYIGITSTDTLTGTSSYLILDAVDLRQLYQTREQLLGIKNDMVLIGTGESPLGILKVENLQGHIVYATPPELRVYLSIESALPVANEVRHLDLSQPDQLDNIGRFKNLRTLQLSHYDGAQLPSDIGTLHELRAFTLSSCAQIRELPASTKQLAKLEQLNIISCSALRNIEEHIGALKTLRTVYTQNYDFQSGFIDKMKEEHPSLRIEAWTGSGEFIDQTVEEEDPIRKPNARPPAQPRKE